MRRRKEGTLAQVETDDLDEATREVQKGSICGLPDFIAKARAMIERVDAAPDRLRAQRARSLGRDLDAIERALTRGVDQAALYDAVGAALTFSALSNAERDDAGTYRKKKSITTGQFLSAENRVRKMNARRGVKRKPNAKEIAGELKTHKGSIDRFARTNLTDK